MVAHGTVPDGVLLSRSQKEGTAAGNATDGSISKELNYNNRNNDIYTGVQMSFLHMQHQGCTCIKTGIPVSRSESIT